MDGPVVLLLPSPVRLTTRREAMLALTALIVWDPPQDSRTGHQADDGHRQDLHSEIIGRTDPSEPHKAATEDTNDI